MHPLCNMAGQAPTLVISNCLSALPFSYAALSPLRLNILNGACCRVLFSNLVVVTPEITVDQDFCAANQPALCMSAGTKATLAYSGSSSLRTLLLSADGIIGANAQSDCMSDGAQMLNAKASCAFQAACNTTSNPSIVVAGTTVSGESCGVSYGSLLTSVISIIVA